MLNPQGWWESDRWSVKEQEWPVLSSTHLHMRDYLTFWNVCATQWMVFRALIQTQAIGQWGRSFSSPPGGLYMSIGCIWPEEASCPSLLSPIVALALAEVLPLFCHLKWVNDLYYGNRKIAGVLIEKVLLPNGQKGCVISAGLNVNSLLKATPDLNAKMTSLYEEMGSTFDLIGIGRAFQQRLRDHLKALIRNEKDDLLVKIHQRLLFRGESIYVKTPKGWFQGLFEGINDQGQVCLRDHPPVQALSIGKTLETMA